MQIITVGNREAASRFRYLYIYLQKKKIIYNSYLFLDIIHIIIQIIKSPVNYIYREQHDGKKFARSENLRCISIYSLSLSRLIIITNQSGSYRVVALFAHERISFIRFFCCSHASVCVQSSGLFVVFFFFYTLRIKFNIYLYVSRMRNTLRNSTMAT